MRRKRHPLLVKRRSCVPVTNPIKNKNTPCHINRRSGVRTSPVALAACAADFDSSDTALEPGGATLSPAPDCETVTSVRFISAT
jgi:hypothetical protein